MRALLDNEMQAAAEEAEAAGRTVVLGDQRVEELGEEVRSRATAALSDLASPLDGGWQRTVQEITQGVAQITDVGQRRREEGREGGEDSLGVQDFLDLEFALGVPVAVVRYVVSTALKAPGLAAAVGAYFAVVAVLPDSPMSDVIGLVLDVLTLRVFLGAVLRDRDEILARSIRSTCESSGGPGRTVVAVLGAAHCNGVRRCILDGRA